MSPREKHKALIAAGWPTFIGYHGARGYRNPANLSGGGLGLHEAYALLDRAHLEPRE